MAWIEGKPAIGVRMTLNLSEAEAEALLKLTLYGTETFISLFKKHLGQLDQREDEGVRTLFKEVREQVPIVLKRAEAARKAFNQGYEGR